MDFSSNSVTNSLAGISLILSAVTAFFFFRDRRRFFFPNIDRGDEFGKKKPPAYRGYRNLGLDFLVASYNLLHEPPDSKSAIQAETLQRHFTSIVYEIVRPHGWLEAIKRLTDRYFAQQKSFEHFLDNDDAAAIGHIWPGASVKGAHNHLSAR